MLRRYPFWRALRTSGTGVKFRLAKEMKGDWHLAARGGRGGRDPAESLWEEWQAAALKTETLCRKQQRLETELVRDVGFPRTKIRLLDNGEKVTIFSLDAIEDIYDSDPKMAVLRAEAEAELAAHQALWNAADEKIGYGAAKREEEEAGDRKGSMRNCGKERTRVMQQC
jgi:hypothetical protein